MSADRTNVNIDYAFTVVPDNQSPFSMNVELDIYARWKDGRKSQPVYRLKLTPQQAQHMAMQIAKEMNRIAKLVDQQISQAGDAFTGDQQ